MRRKSQGQQIIQADALTHAAQFRRFATSGGHLANWVRAPEARRERLVAYLEARAPWDS